MEIIIVLIICFLIGAMLDEFSIKTKLLDIKENNEFKKITYEDLYNNLFSNCLNKFREKHQSIVDVKQFQKLQEKYYKLVKLIDKDKFKLLEESLKNLLDNSFQNILIISKLKHILDNLDYEKLSKQNKKNYKINEDFLKKEKDKFKESLDLYDYIILKLIDIETKNNYDYEDIKNYIDNLVNLNKNHNLDYLETKYLNVDLDSFNSSIKNESKNKKGIKNVY